MSDEEVIAFASDDSRALLTLNHKHFIHLHKAGTGHEGIIVCTFDPDYLGQARRIHAAIAQEQLSGQLIRVNRPA